MKINLYYSFDKYKRLEKPTLILANPNKEYLGSLSFAYGVELELKYTNLSELSFSLPYSVENEVTPFYNEVEQLRYIFMPHYGWFQLHKVNIVSDGIKEEKLCTAYSLECELGQKNIVNVSGTFQFFNPVRPEESLLGLIISELPGWKLGTIDGSLITKFRTFDIREQDVYSFLTNDVANAYECVFVFDTFNQSINAVDINKEFPQTDIFISFDNLAKEINIDSNTDQIKTALRVYGGNELTIRGVNPNGSDTIYNIDYFLNPKWMSEGLITAYNVYKDKYEDLRQDYSDLLSKLKSQYQALQKLNANSPIYSVSFTDKTVSISPELTGDSGLNELQTLYNTLEGIQKARIQQGLSYSDVNGVLSKASKLIVNKKSEINKMESEINSTSSQIANIVSRLRIKDNFTEAQWNELNKFFRYDTFQDNTFIITDNMSLEEQQSVQQELYEFGERVVNRVSYPRYTFTVDSVNFVALPEFSEFTQEFDLGKTITIMLRDDYIIRPILLSIRLNFDNESDFSLTYGNRTRLDDGTYVLDDIFSNASKAGTAISFDLVKLQEMKRQSDDVTEFINGALDAATNNIISSDKQEIKINENGIRFRQWDEQKGKYSPFESWFVNNMLAFSTDNFATANLAIGQIKAPNGGGIVSGVIADAIVGRIVASNTLIVSNAKNNFTLDENGAVLVDASFTLQKGNNQIILSPSEGFSIYKASEKQVYIDTNGNVIFKGNITGGSININNAFQVDSDGNVTINKGSINLGSGNFAVDNQGNVTMKRGSISINNGRFSVDSSGNMTASNAYISGKVESSTLSGNAIDGGNITIGNGNFSVDKNGNVYCASISVRGGNYNVGNINIDASGNLTAKNAYIKGKVEADSGYFSGELKAATGTFSGVYSGKISADQINAGKLAAKYINVDDLYPYRIVSPYNSNDYLTIGASGGYADLTWYSKGRNIFQVYDNVDGTVTLRGLGRGFLYTNGSTTYPLGTWNFNQTTVSGLDLTAKFA